MFLRHVNIGLKKKHCDKYPYNDFKIRNLSDCHDVSVILRKLNCFRFVHIATFDVNDMRCRPIDACSNYRSVERTARSVDGADLWMAHNIDTNLRTLRDFGEKSVLD